MNKILLILVAMLTAAPALSPAAGKEGVKKGTPAQSEPLVAVGNWSMKEADVDRELAGFIYDLQVQVYKQRMQVIQENLANHLLALEAKSTGTTPAALLEREVLSKIPEVSQDQVKSFIDQNKERLPNKGEGMEARVKQMLRNNARETIYEDYLIGLGKKHGAVVNNPLPKAPAFHVDAPADVSRGAASAPVTIVEFSDFECPYCKKASNTAKELERLYPGKIRIAYRHFPMPSHTHAMGAAEASLCAAEQSKFWDYHDILFTNTDKLGQDDLKRHAEQLSLDMGKFNQCLDSNRNLARVQKDARDAARQGVTGTPTFFINSQRLVGAQPIENFKKMIDEELRKKR